MIQEEVNMFQHANKALIAAAFLFWQLSSFPLCWLPEAMVAAIGQVYNFITTDMAWLYLLIGFGMAVGAIVLLTTKFGDIRLGDGMQSRIIKHLLGSL